MHISVNYSGLQPKIINKSKHIYAGFWRKVIAFLVDSFVAAIIVLLATGIIISPLGAILLLLLGVSIIFLFGNCNWNILYPLLPWLGAGMCILFLFSLSLSISIVGVCFYFALLQSSSRQSTIGGYITGITVLNRNGSSISFSKAFFRAATLMMVIFLTNWSLLLVALNIMIFIFDKKKRFVHDVIFKTITVRK